MHRHYAKLFIYIALFNPHKNSKRQENVYILQMGIQSKEINLSKVAKRVRNETVSDTPKAIL